MPIAWRVVRWGRGLTVPISNASHRLRRARARFTRALNLYERLIRDDEHTKHVKRMPSIDGDTARRINEELMAAAINLGMAHVWHALETTKGE